MELKIGQRWLRESEYHTFVLEVTCADPGHLLGKIVQVIKGDQRVGREDAWGFENAWMLKYTYLEGQDRP